LWILGHGGFLGSAIKQKAGQFGFDVLPPIYTPWSDPAARAKVLVESAERFSVFASGSSMTIIWAAGADSVVNTRSGRTSDSDSFHDFVTALNSNPASHGARVVIVSSAGGVYSGSPSPPFDVNSPVQAINQYGLDKIAMEELSRAELSTNFHVHLARVTNLFGPWPGPRQGLINRLCTAAATREALQIYVPLDTVRDYIDVSDAARLLLLELDAVNQTQSSGEPTVSLIGSGESSSVGSVINTVTHVTHRKVPVTMAWLESTQLQPRDLRMEPSWIERGLNFSPLSLPQGVKRLFDSLVTVPRWN
jgi:UDP-glucose 4-epimerase